MSRLALVVLIVLTGCGPDGATEGRADGDARFRSTDGFLLEGEVSGSGADAVILAHMFPADMNSWEDFASRLDDRHRVLRFNFRGYGDSEGEKDIALLDRDVKGAVAFMRAQGAKRIVLVGASMGGTASLVAAATAKVEGVVAVSAPETFEGLDAAAVVRDIAPKKLFIACNSDDTGAAKSAEALFKAALDPASNLRLFACSDHGTDIFQGAKGEEVARVIEGFIAEVLP